MGTDARKDLPEACRRYLSHLLIAVPAFNEEESLRRLLPEIRASFPGVPVVIGLLMTGYALESMRKSRLLARYAILSMLTGDASLICGFFLVVPIALVRIFHVSSFIAAAGLVIFFFFVMVLFYLSTILSRIRSDENATARRCALLEAEIAELRKALGTSREPRDNPPPLDKEPK